MIYNCYYVRRRRNDVIVVYIIQYLVQQRRYYDRNQYRCVNVARGQNSNDEEVEDIQKYVVRSQIIDVYQRFRVSDNYICVFQFYYVNEQIDIVGNIYTQIYRNVGYYLVANAENRQ